MRIVLIAPPFPFAIEPAMDIPLGLAYISSYLKSKGFNDIRLVDFNLLKYDYNKDNFLKEIPLDADLYGITVTTPQFYWYYKISNYIKDYDDTFTVVAGGPHPSSRPDECYSKTMTDMVIIGEGEPIMHHIANKREIFRMTTRSIVGDLNILPFPDRELNNPFDYKRTLYGERAFHVISARDCPFNCSFCSKKAIGRMIRFRSVENFIDEIDYYIKKYGVTRFIIYDDTFTVNKERAYKIAKEFGKRNILWRCFSRTDTVNKELLKTFKENGITSITFGVESFSNKMLNVYNKSNTVENNKKTLLSCKEIGIPVRCSLIYGGPYETRETLQTTIDGVKETQPDEWNWSTFIPIPGSDIGDNPEKYDMKIYDDPFYLKYDRIGENNLKSLVVKISTMSDEEYIDNRKWFVNKLQQVCERKIIQDTIQDIKILKEGI